MHRFTSHGDRAGMFRGHLYFSLPENPICWLLGHKAKVTIVEPKYSDPYRVVRCLWCDRRYGGDPEVLASVRDDHIADLVAGGMPLHQARPEAGKRIQASQVATVRELGASTVAASIEGRDPGWGTRGDDRSSVSLEAVWYPRYYSKTWRWRRVLDNLGFRFHTGGRGSETPVDAAVHLGVASAYVSTSLFGRLAEWAGRGHKRQLSLNTHGGSLWWQLWYDDDGGNDSYHRCDSWRQPKLWPWSAGRRKHRSWMCLRAGSIDLNPASALWGRRLYQREPLVDEPVVVAVPVGEFPGDTYLVGLTLERTWLQRDHGPAFARRRTPQGYSVDWDTRGHCNGIPVRNHDWKGDEVLASSVRLPDGVSAMGDWTAVAVDLIVTQILRDRRHYGYVPPKDVGAQV